MHKYKIILYADNNEKRERGLMFTKPLKHDECALFIFQKPSNYKFWNKNVFYPLQVIFCDKDNKVVAIKHMKAKSTKPCCPNNFDIKYVVEVIDGAANDINIGDTLIIENNGKYLYFLSE